MKIDEKNWVAGTKLWPLSDAISIVASSAIATSDKIRTIKLRIALAVGAAAVAGALGVGYVLAQVLDAPTQVTVAVPAAAAHTLSNATAESLVLKQRSPVRGKAADVRYRRVIAP